MKNYIEIIQNDNELVILKVKDLTNLQIAQKPFFNSEMQYITVTKGMTHILTIIYKNGKTLSFNWGYRGYTLISESLERLKNEVVSFIKSYNIEMTGNRRGG